nr:SpoIIE family protein phosphatase [Rhabdothermincola salaria]
MRESESRLRAVFTAIDQGYCMCELVLDDDGEPVDYRFLETNPLFEAATGLVDATGHTALELVPDLEPHWLETYANVALGGGSLRFEQESPAMGRRFDVFVTAVEPRGRFVLVFSDVTQRHEAEISLRESEAQFRSMADSVPVMIWVTDSEGTCTYLSKRWYDFTGQTPETGLGLGWLEATHPDDRERVEESFLSAAADHRPFELDYRLRRDDGSYRWTLDAGTPRTGADGEFLGYVGSVIDITGRKEAEERLRRLHDEEHRLALRLQRALLPARVVSLPGLDVATHYAAAENALEVGGDWYETFTLADGRLGVAVGDVVGHNLDAAVAMGQLRSGFLALATFAQHPSRLLDAVDAFAVRHAITDFATVCCAFLDPVSGVVSYSSAGHPPMVLVPEHGPVVWLDGARSAPLGLELDRHRGDATVVMEPGSVLVGFSDGLVERRGESIDVGLARLDAVVAAHRHLPVGELGRRIVLEMMTTAGYEDDVVVACVRRLAG